jgi:hypothetical protein
MMPGGNESRNTSRSGWWRRTPSFGGLKITALPTMSAGISVVKVSISG